MTIPAITYPEVAEACQTLAGEGHKITLRAILARTGGSPNAVLPFWKQWRQEQEEITLAAIEEEISPPVKQAILAECARKVSAVKAHFAKKITDSEQQWHDLQALLTEAEQTRQRLHTEITQMQHQMIEQQTRQRLADQQLTDTEKPERYRNALPGRYAGSGTNFH